LTVEAIRFKNFMAFRDTDWIDLRAITLLFGRNSSGKSAFIRALRLLKQSLYTSGNNALLFSAEGQVDLGDFFTALHTRPTCADDWDEMEANKMTFAFRCEMTGDGIELVYKRINEYREKHGLKRLFNDEFPNWVELSLQYSCRNDQDGGDVILVGVFVDCPWEGLMDLTGHELFSAERYGTVERYGNEEATVAVVWTDEWIWGSDLNVGAIEEDVEVLSETLALSCDSSFFPTVNVRQDFSGATDTQRGPSIALIEVLLQNLKEEVGNFLDGIEYLGPIRPAPQRLYMLDQHGMKKWEANGLRSWIRFLEETLNIVTGNFMPEDEWYDDLESDKGSLQNGNTELEMTQIDEWVQALNLGEHARASSLNIPNKLGVSSQVFFFKSSTYDDRENLIDVGYGASQVLPIITASVGAKPGSLVIIEQPELHLHPRAQADLADLFIGKQNDETRFLIETHSEHLLLRMRRRIAETTVGEKTAIHHPDFSKRLFSVLFIDREQNKSTVAQVQINELGEMDSPKGFKGFFADDAIEVAKLTRVRLKRQTSKE